MESTYKMQVRQEYLAYPLKKLLHEKRNVSCIPHRVNLMELAPKGTGKSFVYSNLNKYVWLISGRIISRAQLLFDMARKKAGNSNAGLSFLGNVQLSKDFRPLNENLVAELPSFLQETAFLDRFHGILSGWDIPRLDMKHRVEGVALKADFLSEIFHEFRRKAEYDRFVEDHLHSTGDIRDTKAIKKITSALLKLLFPDLEMVTEEDFREYCFEPAKGLRQRIRSQLAFLDLEYREKVTDMQVVF